MLKKNYGKYMRDDGANKLKAYLAGQKRDLKSMRRDDVPAFRETREDKSRPKELRKILKTRDPSRDLTRKIKNLQ